MITPLSILLQALPTAADTPAAQQSMSLFALLAKGGWVMIPLLLLSVLLIFIATDAWFSLRRMADRGEGWFPDMLDQVRAGDFAKAHTLSGRSQTPLARVIRAGLENSHLGRVQVEEAMQVEARQLTARIEAPVGYLGMIASVAPMLGFLGTIFGVITIFMHISATNELSISSISDGLYQKMICSAVGLLEGIVAYCVYQVLNRRIDRLVLGLDKGANLLMRAMAESGRLQP